MSGRNRITEALREGGALVPFIVAGDPDLGTTELLISELAENGAAVIELGVPFSDPVADGVTIQAAAERALRNSVNVGAILESVARLRDRGETVPIVLFSYFNPIFRFGLGEFARAARKAGVDGVLVTDLVPEEAAGFRSLLDEHGLALIMLAAPTSSDERLGKICAMATGFVYAVSRAGVTGERSRLSSDAEALVSRIRRFTDLPVAVGFGISNRGHVEETLGYADAAVVGSAIVAEIARLTDRPRAELVSRTGVFFRRLRE